MNLKNKILTFFVIFMISSFLVAEENSHNQIFEQNISDFMTLRMNLASCEKPELALKKIDEYCNKNFSGKDYESFSEEEKLVFENFKILEKFNYQIQIPGEEKNVEKMVTAQYEKAKSYLSKNKKQTLNKWFYSTAADLLSCHLNFASVSTILSDGLNVKKYYEKALLQDENLSYALTNLGQWYYFSPGIGGGSKTEALKCFEKALKVCKTDAETYFAKIFLSQILFDKSETKERAISLLNEADSFVPGGSYISKIKKINSAGYSLLKYNAKRMTMNDIEKILSKK